MAEGWVRLSAYELDWRCRRKRLRQCGADVWVLLLRGARSVEVEGEWCPSSPVCCAINPET